jgi:hypothetical protein
LTYGIVLAVWRIAKLSEEVRMDNVVRGVPWGKKRFEKVEEQELDAAIKRELMELAGQLKGGKATEDTELYDEAIAKADAAFIRANPVFMANLDKKVAELNMFLLMRFNFDEISMAIGMHENEVRNMSLGEMGNKLLGSSPAIWKEKAPFFSAIVLQFHKRLRHAGIVKKA